MPHVLLNKNTLYDIVHNIIDLKSKNIEILKGILSKSIFKEKYYVFVKEVKTQKKNKEDLIKIEKYIKIFKNILW